MRSAKKIAAFATAATLALAANFTQAKSEILTREQSMKCLAMDIASFDLFMKKKIDEKTFDARMKEPCLSRLKRLEQQKHGP